MKKVVFGVAVKELNDQSEQSNLIVEGDLAKG